MTISTPFCAQLLRLLQHAVGLAYAGGVSQVDLELPLAGALTGALVREQAHVEILGAVDQPVDGAAREPPRPGAAGVAQKKLRDALLAGEMPEWRPRNRRP